MSDFNKVKSWLNPAETKQVIEYCIEVATWGFPLTHKLLKEIVDDISRARLRDEFYETGVGKWWTDQFVEKHSEIIGAFYTHPHTGRCLGQSCQPNNSFCMVEAARRGPANW